MVSSLRNPDESDFKTKASYP